MHPTETWSDDAEVPGPDRVAGRYELLGLVGQGAMGTVYRARDTALDEIVALKLTRPERALDPGMLTRLRHELRLSRRVTHPNVVRTFDLGEQGGQTFLTMEFLEGGSLGEFLADRGALRPPTAVAIAVAVCAGLQAAHDAGVVHRDLKPDNVMLGELGRDGVPRRVAIGDFGVATVSGAAGGAGSPAWMAPEQLERGPTDPRTDVYAVGTLLFEMLTGARAWPGEDPAVRLTAPAPDPRDLRPELDPSLAALVLRCLARQPEDRFPSAAATGSALAGLELPASSGAAATPNLPSVRARSLAVPPFRVDDEPNDWLGRSLAAELVELLSRSYYLRLRSPTSVTDAAGAERAPAVLGPLLGVDAVLDGHLRRDGDTVEIHVTLTSTADHVALLSRRSRFREVDALPALWSLATEVAGALTVELPAGTPFLGLRHDLLDPYLRARHVLRTHWTIGDLDEAQGLLEQVSAELPDDPAVAATHAILLARLAFRERDAAQMQRWMERGWARSGVALQGPRSGTALLALALLQLYEGSSAQAAATLVRAVAASPGNSQIHHLLGALALECGDLGLARRHLDVALAIDPSNQEARSDRSRWSAYTGDWSGLVRDLDSTHHGGWRAATAASMLYRYHLWSPEVEIRPPPEEVVQEAVQKAPWFSEFLQLAQLVAERRKDHPWVALAMRTLQSAPNPRMRVVRSQYAAEACLALDEPGLALLHVEHAVRAGLLDLQWLDHCPLLAPLRTREDYPPLREQVEARALAVAAALQGASTPLVDRTAGTR